MENKKGFTLIELLAVIVILAIIAVITVPKIAYMITSSRQGGAEDSFYGTLKAAELGYTKALQSNTELKNDECDLSKSSGNSVTCTHGTKITFTGKLPEAGKIVIADDGTVATTGLTLNGYKCSGTLSTNNPCKKNGEENAADQLLENLVGTGSGLYVNEGSYNNFAYRGGTPSNYITFNNELWRIVSVESNDTIKIIRNDFLGTVLSFDAPNLRPVDNNSYCVSSATYGCNAWNKVSGNFVNGTVKGAVTEDAGINKYLNTTYYNSLSQEAKALIVDGAFKIGGVSSDEKYNKISTQATQVLENKTNWIGKIGLITNSEYMFSSTNKDCQVLYNAEHAPYPCKNDNYLHKPSGLWWSMTPILNSTDHNMIIHNFGWPTWYTDNFKGNIRPVLHLKANIELTGTGTQSDPYKIK